MTARVAMVAQSPEHGAWDARTAAAYCENLEAEFAGEGAQRLARAQVLEWVARCGRRAVPAPYWLHPDELSALWRLAGCAPGDPSGVFVSLMEASLKTDPANREGHLFLLDMLRGDGASHSSIEGALQVMKISFPEDPEPCLMLAGHYHTRNAYRKAEAALAEARRRAPARTSRPTCGWTRPGRGSSARSTVITTTRAVAPRFAASTSRTCSPMGYLG